jgi:pilus assembly protein CpaC
MLSLVSGLGGSAIAQVAPTQESAAQTPATSSAQAQPEPEQSAPAENLGGNQVLHILVGHSVVIRTESRLKRVLVGNPAVITTSTTAPNELVVTATTAGSSSVILWQEDNQSRILEVFADLDVSLLRDAIGRGFPGEPVQAEAEEGRVVLTGTASAPAVADQIGKMAAPFSKDIVNSIRIAEPGRRKQVLLKVRFAQVDRARVTTLGFNLFSTGATNTFGATSTQQFGRFSGANVGSVPKNVSPGTVTGNNIATGAIGNRLSGQPGAFGLSDLMNLFLFRSDLNLGAVIQDLQQRNVLQILAEPNLLAANGEPASFLAGGELPYPVLQGSGGNSTVTVQFKPFGVKLEFTGTIEDDNTIRLKVFPEVSSLDFTNAVTISGFVLPAIATRHAETVIELKNGQSFGIAGLLDQRTTAQFSKVPGIGDLPIIGQLFRSKSINKTNSELMVIVTPTIVDFANAPAAVLPKAPMPPLDPKQFDTKIPSGNGSR